MSQFKKITQLDKILDSATTSKIIPDFEENRNKIINTLDKLFATWKPREKYEFVNANETQDKVVPHKLVY